MNARRAGGGAAALVVGLVVGAVLTLSIQGTAIIPEERDAPSMPEPILTPELPDTFLAWSPGGMPARFADAVAEMPQIRRAVVVASDNT